MWTDLKCCMWVSYLCLAILFKVIWQVGWVGKFQKPLLSVGFTKLGRRYQVAEPARLFKGGWKSKASYLKLVLQRAQVSRERAGVQTLSFRWLYVETFRGHMVKIGLLSLYTCTTCSQDYWVGCKIVPWGGESKKLEPCSLKQSSHRFMTRWRHACI